MSAHYSPFTRRFLGKLEHEALKRSVTFKDAMAIQRAFVAALKEEVEARYSVNPLWPGDATTFKPLVIAGLGSFKMRTRPAREFRDPPGHGRGRLHLKSAARRLVFTAKWEEIK